MRFLVKPFIFLFITCTILICAANSFAVELRVIDSVGLIRAVHSVKSKGQVNLSIVSREPGGNLPEYFLLVSQDGLASDVRVVHEGNGRYSAANVPAGTWKTDIAEKSFEIKDVKIVD